MIWMPLTPRERYWATLGLPSSRSWSCSSDRAAATAACAPVAAAALPSHRDAHGRHQGGLEHPHGRCKAVKRNGMSCAARHDAIWPVGLRQRDVVHRSSQHAGDAVRIGRATSRSRWVPFTT